MLRPRINEVAEKCSSKSFFSGLLAVKKGGRGRLIGHKEDGMTTNLHAGHRKRRASDQLLHHGLSSERLCRRVGAVLFSTWARLADRRPGLRRRLVSGGAARQGNTALHPRPEVARQTRLVRQASLETAQPHRDHVRRTKGLATRRHLLRPLPEGLPLRHHLSCNCHLLALIVNGCGA